MNNLRVSAQAFLQQIQSWNTTLNRQSKKLTSLKTNIKNKFKLNSIEIVLTEIQSLQINYKKIRTKYQSLFKNQNSAQNFQNRNQKTLSDDLLNEYSELSNSFMQILEKISSIEAQIDEPSFYNENEQNKQQFQAKSRSVINTIDKTFLNETFTYKMSKENRNKKNKSIIEKRNSNKQKQLITKESGPRGKTHSMLTKMNDISNIVPKKQTVRGKNVSRRNSQNIEQDNSLWQIRQQLSLINQMMKEMRNEIKFHEHEETNQQINKLQTKNRKIASQLKSVKEENRLILSKIEQLKKDLADEKKTQVDLINRFQKKSFHTKHNLYDSIATHADHYASLNGQRDSSTHKKDQSHLHDVSDWVKMRI